MVQTLDPQRKTSRDVQRMFHSIAPRYDLLNRVLSAGRDGHWRRATVERALAGWDRRDLETLDVCCGTGDLARAFQRDSRVARVTGVDFVTAMVQRARRRPGGAPRWLVGDALHLPVRTARFDVVSIAFGLRNLVDPAAGLQELARTLRPGGRIAVLEFFRPPEGLMAWAFRCYFRHVLPRVGRLLTSGSAVDAYRYLPESVESFASPKEVTDWLLGAGFAAPVHSTFTLGSVGLFVAELPSPRNRRAGLNANPSESVSWSTA